MKAIILAAGYATRLYPLTKDQPKPLLSVGDKPIIEHIMRRIEQVQDIDEVFVVTNAKFHDHFTTWKEGYSTTKPVHIINDGTSSNEDRLGAVGDIHYVLKHKQLDDHVLVIAGDNLFDFCLNGLIGTFKDSGLSTLALYDLEDPKLLANKFGTAVISEKMKITELQEKPAEPKTSLAATCCYVFTKEDCKKLQAYLQNGAFDNPGELGSWLVTESGLQAHTFTGSWFDIGSFESLEEAGKKYTK